MKANYVATSINPFAKLEYQLLCANRWSEIGYKFVCFQTQKEADVLISAGLDASLIQVIDQSETGASLHGIPSPRILSVLIRLSQLSDLESVVLTNSDIFPNIRKPFDFRALTGLDSAALTRREIPIAELAETSPDNQYYGGLDIFYLSEAAVREGVKYLKTNAVSERMAYGIPGWDYYIGSMIITKLNGIILSGPDFLHVSHTPTYQNVNEFGHYIGAIIASNVLPEIKDHSPQNVALHFEHLIKTQCQANLTVSARISRIYKDHFNKFSERYKNSGASFNESGDEDEFQPPVQAIEFLHNKGYLDDIEQGILLSRYACQKSYNAQVQSVFCKSKAAPIEYRQLLASVLFMLRSRIKCGNIELTSQYPENSLHRVVLKQILDHSAGYFDLRLRIAKLFAGDMLQYSIVNKSALKAMCLACVNDEERELMTRILGSLKEVDRAQSA